MNKLAEPLRAAFDRGAAVLLGFWYAPGSGRAYASLRIGLALTSLLQLLSLWPDRLLLFQGGKLGDAAAGMIDATVIQGPMGAWSLSHALGSEAACGVALGLFALAMLALAAGVSARAAAVVVAYWHSSLSFDLAPAMSGYDHVLRLASLVLVVSPLGLPWSLPAWRRARAPGRGRWVVPSPPPIYGLRLLRWQVACIYLATVWLKAPDAYWRSGEFMSYFMLSTYSLLPGARWEQWPQLSVVMTYATLAIETALPFLLLQRRWRGLGFALGFGLHIGIALTSTLWLFSLSMLVLYPAFLEDGDLDRWRRWLLARMGTRFHV